MFKLFSILSIALIFNLSYVNQSKAEDKVSIDFKGDSAQLTIDYFDETGFWSKPDLNLERFKSLTAEELQYLNENLNGFYKYYVVEEAQTFFLAGLEYCEGGYDCADIYGSELIGYRFAEYVEFVLGLEFAASHPEFSGEDNVAILKTWCGPRPKN